MSSFVFNQNKRIAQREKSNEYATLISNNIRNYLGYFIVNNASSNDTLMNYGSADLASNRILYDVWYYKLRYNSHIINLAVCTFFSGKHADFKIQVEHSREPCIETFIQKLNV